MHLQLFMVGVKDGTSIGTISKKSFPSDALGDLPAFVTFARISVVKVLLPECKKNCIND